MCTQHLWSSWSWGHFLLEESCIKTLVSLFLILVSLALLLLRCILLIQTKLHNVSLFLTLSTVKSHMSIAIMVHLACIFFLLAQQLDPLLQSLDLCLHDLDHWVLFLVVSCDPLAVHPLGKSQVFICHLGKYVAVSTHLSLRILMASMLKANVFAFKNALSLCILQVSHLGHWLLWLSQWCACKHGESLLLTLKHSCPALVELSLPGSHSQVCEWQMALKSGVGKLLQQRF